MIGLGPVDVVWLALHPGLEPLRKTHPLLRPLAKHLYDLPCPPNLRIWWNFGSLLGACLVCQITTGLLLAVHYTPHSDLAFSSVVHIMRDVRGG